MDEAGLRKLLSEVAVGRRSVDEAIGHLRTLPFEDLGFAKVDHHRAIRCGFPEVIYCEGKQTDQVVAIARRRIAGGGNLLATRANPQVARKLRKLFPSANYNELARTITVRQQPCRPSNGYVAIVCAGTSDLPVAEEARETCEIMDQPTRQFYDVGVAGIHRLLAHSAALMEARCIVVCAGMEGALPSVVGGLVSCPVIAVPTSVGYGANLGGIAALLTMLNTCASGVAVVNIDNGFGAGYMAALISRVGNGPQAPTETAAETAPRTRRKPAVQRKPALPRRPTRPRRG